MEIRIPNRDEFIGINKEYNQGLATERGMDNIQTIEGDAMKTLMHMRSSLLRGVVFFVFLASLTGCAGIAHSPTVLRDQPTGVTKHPPITFQKPSFVHQNPIVRVHVVAERTRQDSLGRGRIVDRLTGTGSGFLVNTEGYVITNEHVISPKNNGIFWSDADILVAVDVDRPSERVYKAKIVAKDQELDIAVLKMLGTWKTLTVARLGHNSGATLGTQVMVKGYPRGGPYTETVGKVLKVLSAAESKTPSGAIASDADAVPGNSGGPLVSNNGVVLGVAVKSLWKERVEEIKQKSEPSLKVMKKGYQTLGVGEDSVKEMMKIAREAGVQDSEIEEKYRDTMGTLGESRKQLKSAIQTLAEMKAQCYSIPVDSVRAKLEEWKVPFESVAAE